MVFKGMRQVLNLSTWRKAQEKKLPSTGATQTALQHSRFLISLIGA
jgi:hypothetical protein